VILLAAAAVINAALLGILLRWVRSRRSQP
jgi:hypothetical protein